MNQNTLHSIHNDHFCTVHIWKVICRVDNWNLSLLTHIHQEAFFVLLIGGSALLGESQAIHWDATMGTGPKQKLKQKHWSEAELTVISRI